MQGVIEVLDDRHVQEALGGTVERRLRATHVAPLLARRLDASVDGGHLQRLLDVGLDGPARSSTSRSRRSASG